MADGRLRIRFSKTGKARYISHLDLMAVMRRALLRAGVKLRYSQGFNPHPYISAALPLSVGCASVCELLDVEAAEALPNDATPASLNALLPEGIEVAEIYVPRTKFSDIAWLTMECELYFDAAPSEGAIESLSRHLASQSLVISKKTKSGSSDIDIAPFIRDPKLLSSSGNAAKLTATVSAQNPTITPANILSAMKSLNIGAAPDLALFTRLETLGRDMAVFR